MFLSSRRQRSSKDNHLYSSLKKGEETWKMQERAEISRLTFRNSFVVSIKGIVLPSCAESHRDRTLQQQGLHPVTSNKRLRTSTSASSLKYSCVCVRCVLFNVAFLSCCIEGKTNQPVVGVDIYALFFSFFVAPFVRKKLLLWGVCSSVDPPPPSTSTQVFFAQAVPLDLVLVFAAHCR